MGKEARILKQHIESLGLDKKSFVSFQDQVRLRDSLRLSNELGLAQYIEELSSPDELQDLIVNTIYG